MKKSQANASFFDSKLFSFDNNLLKNNLDAQWVIGVDEVGRGPLAGPVTACAVALHISFFNRFSTEAFHKRLGLDPLVWSCLNDSKAIKSKTREALCKEFHKLDSRLARAVIASVGPKEIDKINILEASLLAMQRCVDALLVDSSADYVVDVNSAWRKQTQLSKRSQKDLLDHSWPVHPDSISNYAFDPLVPSRAILLVDGVHLPRNIEEVDPYQAVPLKKGDQTSFAVALASVLAKENRDLFMKNIANVWPGYQFEKHMGYGTKAHLQALQSLGPCDLHRMSFAPVRRLQIS